jgi:GNAT superfamily N-acetyltransferase
LKLKDLIKKHTFLSVSYILLELYPEEKKNLHGYGEVYDRLLTLPESESDMMITLRKVPDKDFAEGFYIDVSGRKVNPSNNKNDEHTTYGIEFHPWSEILGMEIEPETLRNYTELEIIAHCLYEITFISFDEEEIRKEWDNIKKMTDEIDNMSEEEKKEKFISLDDLLAELDKEHTIRRANPEEADILTDISFASKKHWNYPDDYFILWKDELTISKDYIQNNNVFVFEEEGEIQGYYSLVHLKKRLKIGPAILEKGTWLEHMFVLPDNIGEGIGSELTNHMKNFCEENDIQEIKTLADPNAVVFYLKMGFEYIKKVPSTIPGRFTPMLVYRLS